MAKIRRIMTGAAVVAALALNTLGGGVAFAQEAEDPNLVHMQDNTFLKPELTVPVGTTVSWLNLDPQQHNVVERFALIFESPLINQGEVWTLTFDAPGTYAYVCDLHANMEGVVNVV